MDDTARYLVERANAILKNRKRPSNKSEVRYYVSKLQEAISKGKTNNVEFRKSLETLMLDNVKLVLKFAGRYSNGNGNYEEAVQNGFTAYLNAIRLYNPNRGINFSTYVCSAMIKEMKRKEIERIDRKIKIPKLKNLIDLCEEELRVSLERQPSEEELLKHMEKRSEQSGVRKIKRDTIRQAIRSSKSRSLEYNELYDDVNFYPEEECETEDSKSYVKEVLNNAMKSRLTKRERYILKKHVCTNGEGKTSLEKIGKKFGFTKERARQIEAKALRKLREVESLKSLTAEIL